jgi:hypothetical protein
MGIPECQRPSFYPLERIVPMVEFDEVWGMCLISVFPSIVAFSIPLSFDEVLELSRLSIMLVALDLLHFVFLFPINQVRWRSGEVWAM